MLMRLLTFRRVLRRRRIMPLKGLCKPPAQPVVMIFNIQEYHQENRRYISNPQRLLCGIFFRHRG